MYTFRCVCVCVGGGGGGGWRGRVVIELSHYLCSLHPPPFEHASLVSASAGSIIAVFLPLSHLYFSPFFLNDLTRLRSDCQVWSIFMNEPVPRTSCSLALPIKLASLLSTLAGSLAAQPQIFKLIHRVAK